MPDTKPAKETPYLASLRDHQKRLEEKIAAQTVRMDKLRTKVGRQAVEDLAHEETMLKKNTFHLEGVKKEISELEK